jgi:hypothetical protein
MHIPVEQERFVMTQYSLGSWHNRYGSGTPSTQDTYMHMDIYNTTLFDALVQRDGI